MIHNKFVLGLLGGSDGYVMCLSQKNNKSCVFLYSQVLLLCLSTLNKHFSVGEGGSVLFVILSSPTIWLIVLWFKITIISKFHCVGILLLHIQRKKQITKYIVSTTSESRAVLAGTPAFLGSSLASFFCQKYHSILLQG